MLSISRDVINEKFRLLVLILLDVDNKKCQKMCLFIHYLTNQTPELSHAHYFMKYMCTLVSPLFCIHIIMKHNGVVLFPDQIYLYIFKNL